MLSPEVRPLVDSKPFVDRPGLEIRARGGVRKPVKLELAKGMKTEGPTVAQDAHFWIQCRQGEHPEDMIDTSSSIRIFSEELVKKSE